MVNFKNITDVPVVESAEGLNLIVNDNGSAKQIAASAVGAQADWTMTDENHPAYIKNKPDLSKIGGQVVVNLDDYGIGFMSLTTNENGIATKTIDGIELFNVCDAAFNNNNQIKFSTSLPDFTVFFDPFTILSDNVTHEIYEIIGQIIIINGPMILEGRVFFIKDYNESNSTTAIAFMDGHEFSLEPEEPSGPL